MFFPRTSTGRHAADVEATDTAWFDAEADARLAGRTPTRRGRRAAQVTSPRTDTLSLRLLAGGAA